MKHCGITGCAVCARWGLDGPEPRDGQAVTERTPGSWGTHRQCPRCHSRATPGLPCLHCGYVPGEARADCGCGYCGPDWEPDGDGEPDDSDDLEPVPPGSTTDGARIWRQAMD